MILADQIRQYVRDHIISPARRDGDSTVAVRAGDVHDALRLENRMPAVCGALDARIFLEYAQVKLVQREGPRQGANAHWTFGLK